MRAYAFPPIIISETEEKPSLHCGKNTVEPIEQTLRQNAQDDCIRDGKDSTVTQTHIIASNRKRST